MGINNVLDEVRLLVMNCACISLIANQTSTMAMCGIPRCTHQPNAMVTFQVNTSTYNAMVTCWNIQVYPPSSYVHCQFNE